MKSTRMNIENAQGGNVTFRAAKVGVVEPPIAEDRQAFAL